jgi:hypothetical protein
VVDHAALRRRAFGHRARAAAALDEGYHRVRLRADGIGIGIHYLSKFVAAGPAVRGGLARAFGTGERLLILQERGVGPKDLEDWPPRLATGKLVKLVKQAGAELESVLTGS